MKQTFIGFTLVLLLSLQGCSNKTPQASSDEKNIAPETTANASSQTLQRYGIKSGTIIYKAPMEMKQSLYFDDFGKREVLISEMSMTGMNFKDIEIHKDGFIYKYKAGEKTGTKLRWNIQDQNYDKLDPEMAKQFKLKDMGTDEMAGKKCKKFSMEVGGSPVYAWIWNGISVKTVTNMMGKEFVIEAIKIDEGPVPQELFEVPADITFTETN
jgi:hypothetical protein